MRTFILAAITLTIVGCSSEAPEITVPQKAVSVAQYSKLDSVKLSKGMKRGEAEVIIESATGAKSNYSEQYPTESETEAQYTDGIKTLSVSYKAGAPAPYVQTPDGNLEHYPPIDQEVQSWVLKTNE